MENKPTHLILHHSSVGTNRNQLTPINRYHRILRFPLSERGWHIGYHYIIEKDGRVIQTRNDGERGAHTLGWNDRSIGICLAGDFNRYVPTKEQLVSLRGLIKTYNLPWKFHKEAQKGRTCAGYYLTRDLIESTPEPESLSEIEKRENIQKQITALQALIERLQKVVNSFTR